MNHLQKQNILRFGALIALAFSAWACQVPAPKGADGEGQGDGQLVISDLLNAFEDVSSEFQEMAKPNQVEAWVDKLIVKVQPGKEMQQVATLKEGEKAEYLYQRTMRKSEFILREQRYYEPWILIKTKDGIMGWVHEGGVRYVSPDFNNLLTELTQPTSPNARTRSADPVAAAPNLNDRTIVPGKRVGPIKLTTTEEDLIRMFGPSAIGRGQVKAADGKDEPCTTVLQGTNDELRIAWKDDARTKVKAVYFLRPNAKWYTKEGLTVGMPLMELTKANKSPLSFYGLNWAYSGTVSSWRSGAMKKYDKYFYVVLAPTTRSAKAIENFKGNQIFTSNTKGVESLGLMVEKVVVYLD